MIVMKFGGSSVESAIAIERVAGIVKSRIVRRPIVVVSAMGKTTNRLLEIARQAVAGHRDAALEMLVDLEQFHIWEGGSQEIVGPHFAELRELVKGLAIMGELTARATDAISAFGERLSSMIVTELFRTHGLDAAHVDSRQVILTDNRHTQAAPLYAESYEKLAAAIPPLIDAGKVVVMGGFIGSTREGVTSTLGRGGSDFTASIVGAGVGAEEIQIWTDVDGMLTCDPRILAGGHRIKTCSFAEAAELAYFGAKVLHPATVVPAIEKNIPVLILNSRRPEIEGTRIVGQSVTSENPVKSIACKQNITVVNIHSSRMLMAHGFLRRIFEVFDRFETPVDVVSTSEVSVSLTIDSTAHLDSILSELREFSEVSSENSSALISLVGENIRSTSGVASRAFSAIHDVNIRMISQGASVLNISFVVAQSDLQKSVTRLHQEFFSQLDPEVFE
ncbi:MAG TPA: lysine-sensitive aspartokinase 3 [Bryobacteraceae bacterium]|jgi:aspartate kinase